MPQRMFIPRDFRFAPNKYKYSPFMQKLMNNEKIAGKFNEMELRKLYEGFQKEVQNRVSQKKLKGIGSYYDNVDIARKVLGDFKYLSGDRIERDEADLIARELLPRSKTLYKPQKNLPVMKKETPSRSEMLKNKIKSARTIEKKKVGMFPSKGQLSSNLSMQQKNQSTNISSSRRLGQVSSGLNRFLFRK